MHKLRRTFALTTAALVLTAGEAGAWGPVTHVYLVQRIAGTQDSNVIYGAMAPDFYTLVLSNPQAQGKLQRLTHFEFDRIDRSWFALGFATHNGEWGADRYAHAYYDPIPPDIFSVNKIHQLSDEFGISLQDAEFVFEAAVDYLLRIESGPEIGLLMQESATHSAPEGLLVKAFAQPLSERVPGMSLADAEQTIRGALASFRQMTVVYGQQFAQDDATVRSLVIIGLRVAMGCSSQEAQQYFARAEEICKDEVMDEMDRICALVGAEMEARQGYYLPLWAWPCALAMLLAALWLVPGTARRRAPGLRQRGTRFSEPWLR